MGLDNPFLSPDGTLPLEDPPTNDPGVLDWMDCCRTNDDRPLNQCVQDNVPWQDLYQMLLHLVNIRLTSCE